jgi:hypothetical protein
VLRDFGGGESLRWIEEREGGVLYVRLVWVDTVEGAERRRTSLVASFGR